MKLKLENVRLAFPVLFQPKAVNGEGEPAFSCTFLIPKDHASVKEIADAVEVIGATKWGTKWPTVRKEIEARDRSALHDGNTKAGYGGFEGQLFVSARNRVRPLVLDRDRTALDERAGRLYSGCYVNGLIQLWCQDNNFGKRINASLLGVQFLRDGDAFSGGGVASLDEFADLVGDIV